MKKNLLKLLTLVLMLSILGGQLLSLTPAAADVMPTSLLCNSLFVDLVVYPGDGAYVTVDYSCDEDLFEVAAVTMKVQKKVLFLWITVDQPTNNDQFYRTYYVAENHVYHQMYDDGEGTYRAKVTIEFTGTDGTTESFQRTVEYTTP